MTATSTRNLLSVRLDAALAEAHERHCAQTGATRSQVVKQNVAQYIVAHAGPTLGSLAEAVLPRAPRQKRFRDYVRKKRRR